MTCELVSDEAFDVVTTYKTLLSKDGELTKPVAAILAILEALATSQPSTISETLDVVSKYAEQLKAAIHNPISLTAGTDIFQRYLVTALEPHAAVEDFTVTRDRLIRNGHRFVENAKAYRKKIASYGPQMIKDGNTILTNGGSRVVSAVLHAAADDNINFRVIYVLPQAPLTDSLAVQEGQDFVDALRKRGVPVATIPESAVAYSLKMFDKVIVGAEGVVENGGIISRLGTYQIGLLAKSMNKPFYVVAETHKFLRLYPQDQYDLGVIQNIVDFKTADPRGEANPPRASKNNAKKGVDGSISNTDVTKETREGWHMRDAIDFTLPELITNIVTEFGIYTPSAVSEELVKIWF